MTERTETTFEDSLTRLKEIVGVLERGEAPLEEGLALFEEGVTLTRRCHEMLEAAGDRIRRLVDEGDGTIRLEPFEEPEE